MSQNGKGPQKAKVSVGKGSRMAKGLEWLRVRKAIVTNGNRVKWQMLVWDGNCLRKVNVTRQRSYSIRGEILSGICPKKANGQRHMSLKGICPKWQLDNGIWVKKAKSQRQSGHGI